MYKVEYIDICREPFFKGSKHPIIKAKVDRDTTYDELMLVVLSTEKIVLLTDEEIDCFNFAVEELFAPFIGSNRKFEDSKGILPSDTDHVYAWFTVKKV